MSASIEDYETGETIVKPIHRQYFAAPICTLSLKPARQPKPEPDWHLTDEELARAEKIWARLPSFDALVKGK